MSYSAYHWLNPFRKLKDNTYPIKLVVNINGERKNYKTDYSFTKNDWEKLNGQKLRDQDLKDDKRHLEDQIKEVKSILADLDFPTHESFEKKYNQKRLIKNQNVRYWFDVYYNELKKQNKSYSTLRLLNTTINALERFKSDLKFQDVTPKFLAEFETWVIDEEKNSAATAGTYITRLRIIFNYAIAENIIPRDIYPFGKQNSAYVIKSVRGRKPALTLNQVEKLLKMKCDTDEIKFARDMWVFCYLLNGSNIIDVCRLRYKNIDFHEKTFNYIRTKTRGTQNIIIRVEGALHPTAERIIKKYGNKDKSPDNYVFPFLQELKGEEIKRLKDEYNIKIELLKRINNNLKPFKKKLKISYELTIGIARHTFASVLHYELGIPIALVGQAMSHSSVVVTENYLAGMDREQRKTMNLGLLPIKERKKSKK